MKNLILWVLLFAFENSYSQNEFRCFGANDSTFHELNIDTTIIVSPNKLYFNSLSGLNLIYDFSSFISVDEFINDFEIISDNIWYVMIRSRYWGYNATLFKTIDKGTTWNIDSSYYSATQQAVDSFQLNSGSKSELYQLQKISNDTLLLFVGYYTSAIFYSTDGGLNWQMWFSNQINNYRGLFKCNDSYYLWSLNGDAFNASMFRFDSNIFLSPDTNGVWLSYSGVYHPPCYNGDTINCIYAINAQIECSVFLFFKNYVDSICANVTSIEDPLHKKNISNIKVYPNPLTSDIIHIESNEKIINVSAYSMDRRELSDIKKSKFENQINLFQIKQSPLLIRIETMSGTYERIIIKAD